MRDLIPQTAGASSGHFAQAPQSPRSFIHVGIGRCNSFAPDLQTASTFVDPTSSVPKYDKHVLIFVFLYSKIISFI